MDYTKNLTLVLNTKDRPIFLNTLLYYYSSVGFRGQLIICDASSNENLEINKSLVRKWNSLVIKYNKIREKQIPSIIACLDQIDTNYAGVICDDDLLCYTGLNKSILLLENNRYIKSVWGNGVKLTLGQDKPYEDIIGTKIFKHNIYDIQKSINASNRYLQYMKQPYDLIWAIRRHDDFKSIFNFLKYFAGERWLALACNSYCAINHPVHRVDYLYLIRQNHRLREIYSLPERMSILNLFKEDTFPDNLNSFQDKISIEIATLDNITREKSKEIVNQGLSIYFNNKLMKIIKKYDQKDNNKGTINHMENYIIKINSKLSRIYERLRNRKTYRELNEILELLGKLKFF